MMIALVGTVGMTSFAQTQNSQQCSNSKTECCSKQKSGQCDRQKTKPDFFEGITLSADQQAKLDKIKTDRQAKMKAAREQAKQAKQQRKQQKTEARKASQKEYLAEIKEVLTPDQYVVFLENIVVNQPQQKMAKQFDRSKKDMKKCDRQKGQRPAGNARNNQVKD